MPSVLVTSQEKVPRSSREGLLKMALDLKRKEMRNAALTWSWRWTVAFKETYFPPWVTIVRRDVSVIAL